VQKLLAEAAEQPAFIESYCRAKFKKKKAIPVLHGRRMEKQAAGAKRSRPFPELQSCKTGRHDFRPAR
jgi:hypothetical protein